MLACLTEFTFYFQVPLWLPCSLMGTQLLDVCPATTLWSIPLSHVSVFWWWSVVHTRVLWVAAPSTASSREQLHATYSTVSKPFNQYSGIYSFWGSAGSNPIPLPYLHGREGCSLPGCVSLNDKINSNFMVGITSGDSGLVIGYQFDEYTCTWLAEHLLLNYTPTLVSHTRCQH